MPAASAAPATIQGLGPPPLFFAFGRAPPICGLDGATVACPGFWFVGASPLARALIRLGFILRIRSASGPPRPRAGSQAAGACSRHARLFGRLSFLGRGFLTRERTPDPRGCAARDNRGQRAEGTVERGPEELAKHDVEFYQALAPPNLHTYAGDMQLGKAERQRLIGSLVSRKRVGTQFELLDALADAGCVVTQATVSRDIRQLGLEKTHDHFGRPRYVLPHVARRADPTEVLTSILGQFGRKVTPAGNVVVLQSELGSAPAIARALDQLEHERIVGTLAGDDTVLVVAPSERDAKSLARELAGVLA
jgi:transcriptional regulator of arginine metabolism